MGQSLQRISTVLDRSASLVGMAYNFGWECNDWKDYDVAGHEGHFEIDIGAELLRAASEALVSVGKAIWAAECLRAPLWEISHAFRTIPFDQHRLPSDDCEFCAANALKDVHALLRQQTDMEALPLPAAAVMELKALQRHAQDVAVLANSRFVSQGILQGNKGIPDELLCR